ncbi:DNA repair protein RecN [Henriciella sp. AS95]|uniref:DNA repair protein RecN n=1 Tax=Henriciella sp. AS95 TaxID=3135782 RepID=UPI00317E896F
MIIALSIRSFLLIERLDIEVAQGFTALTGETGAGKSIILDALGQALGDPANRKFVRKGEDQASVLAEFCLPPDHPVWAVLTEQGVEASPFETLMLKRVISSTGPARAFINDQPASAGLLQAVGETLVEIHGQHAASGLMKPAQHRSMLDLFAGNEDLLTQCAATWKTYQEKRAAREALEADLAESEERYAWLSAAAEELDVLGAEAGEYDRLSSERGVLMHSEKIAESVAESVAACDEGDIEGALARASRSAERVLRIDGLEASGGPLSKAAKAAAEALERALIEFGEARSALDLLADAAVHDPASLEKAEQRLFALKSAARKYNVEPDKLSDFTAEIAEKLDLFDAPERHVEKARSEEKDAAARWRTVADRLSQARMTAARQLEASIETELKPLKLDRTRVRVRFDEIEEGASGAMGREKVEFEVETNPGAGFGPLRQIASGGELARFSLALQCVLAESNAVPVMVFDEADQGVGGAVAAAIGERLSRLATSRQVFAITHSPQVAAAASGQWLISKDSNGQNGLGRTVLTGLDADARHEEIARMLSGSTITEEARAAASRLLEDV